MRILKRKKLKIGGLILVVIITAGFAAAKEDFKTETDNLKKNFPNLRVDSIKESPIKGLYEIVAGNQVFYFSPDGYLMFGELWSKDGKNLTAEMREKVLAEKVKSIPLDKALKIGSGPRQVIEFTDPDCPYCRKVDELLAKRTDVTRYVFSSLFGRSIPMLKRRCATSCRRKTEKRHSFTSSAGHWMAIR